MRKRRILRFPQRLSEPVLQSYSKAPVVLRLDLRMKRIQNGIFPRKCNCIGHYLQGVKGKLPIILIKVKVVRMNVDQEESGKKPQGRKEEN